MLSRGRSPRKSVLGHREGGGQQRVRVGNRERRWGRGGRAPPFFLGPDSSCEHVTFTLTLGSAACSFFTYSLTIAAVERRGEASTPSIDDVVSIQTHAYTHQAKIIGAIISHELGSGGTAAQSPPSWLHAHEVPHPDRSHTPLPTCDAL